MRITSIKQAERELGELDVLEARRVAREVRLVAVYEPWGWKHAGYASPLEAARVLVSGYMFGDVAEYAALLVARDIIAEEGE